jgi:hypothetical protein
MTDRPPAAHTSFAVCHRTAGERDGEAPRRRPAADGDRRDRSRSGVCRLLDRCPGASGHVLGIRGRDPGQAFALVVIACEIAERLFLSRNTVKTQAIFVYRKLGVSSRSEAIARAADLGLVRLDTQ